MEIKFIGTGSGKTSLSRFHSSILFLSNDYNLLIDCGDGVSKALLALHVPFNLINGIMISHLHPDHFSGLSALIIQMKLTQRKNDLNIFVQESLVDVVKDFIYHSYIFKEKMDFDITYIPFANESLYKIAGGFSFIAKQNTHLDSYRVYDHLNNLSFASSSFLFTFNSKNIHYTGDAGNSGDLFLFKDYEKDILISEISHINIPDLINIAGSLNIKKLILTHIGDEDEPALAEIKSQNNPAYKIEIIQAYDSLSILL